MTNFDKILRFLGLLLLGAAFCAPSLRATSFSYTPDTVKFTPNGLDSTVGYVRIAYTGDSSGPGTNIHAWLPNGPTCFIVPGDTVHTTTYFYLRIVYHTQSDTVTGVLVISDDTTERDVVLIGYPNPPVSALAAEGPYFPNILEGHDTCSLMRLVNTSSNPDTIFNVGWKHNPNGIFTWDSASLPYILGAHDTVFWTFCFHAPDNTQENIDTLLVFYDNQTHYITRIVEAAAITSDGALSATGPYFSENIPEGVDTCVSMRLINTGSGADTVKSINWSHNPNGIFTWNSTTIPFTIGAHDTTNLTFCFHAPYNTDTYRDTLTVQYNDATGSGWFDTRLVVATAVDTAPPDGDLTAVGPYFPSVVDEGHDTCVTMRIINNGNDMDTIVTASENLRTGWKHDPNGVFSWDSVSLPATVGSHDTVYWTFCFHAPDDTNLYIDTFNIYYHDEYSQTRYISRIVEGKATDPSIVSCYSLYANTATVTNIGDTSYIHMYIGNHLSSSTTLTGCHISGSDDAAFRVDSANFPITIPANAYDSVWLMFIPNRHTGSLDYTATLTASFTTSDTSHCREATVALAGSMPQICSDTETVYFDTTGTSDVDLSGDSGHYYAHRIDFVNNSGSTVIVSAVSWLHSSTHFLVSQIVPVLPDTLAQGAGMAVIIHFYGDSSGTIYLDTLALTIENSIASHGGKFIPMSSNAGVFYINFKGYSNSAPAGVPTAAIPNAPELQLYPNPSEGLVNIELEGAANAAYEVMDVLGHVIESHTGSGLWQWNASSASGLSDGTYFIRATSTDSSGNPVVTTKRLVLKR